MDFGALAGAISQIFTPWTFMMMFTGTALGIIASLAIASVFSHKLPVLTVPDPPRADFMRRQEPFALLMETG